MIKLLPYSPEKTPGTFKRILAKPIPKPAHTSDAGLSIPNDVGTICTTGEVFAVCDGSVIKVGDTVIYQKYDRTSNEHLDTISLDGQVYDVLYEPEVWAVNGNPLGRIFAKPVGDLSVTDGELVIPSGTIGVTQKGIVFRAPADFMELPGDTIEYRKQERDMYPTIEIEGERYDVLYAGDVYLINGRVSPYRVTVRIDMAAQHLKRSFTQSGLVLSPLFAYMLHNLQYGEITDIGVEAAKKYPDLRIGDTAILHHTVESQPYRVIKKETGKHGHVIYETRIINCVEEETREILGRISSRDKKVFVSYGKSLFLEWDFELYGQDGTEGSFLSLDMETGLDKCKNLDNLKSAIAHKKEEGIKKAQAKMRGLVDILKNITDVVREKDRYDEKESELNLAKKEAERVAEYLNRNHLLLCKGLNSEKKYLVPYKEIYPINILGKKFLIAYRDFVVAEINISAAESVAAI